MNFLRAYKPTAEELAVWSLFPEKAVARFHLRTGLTTRDGKRHWYQIDVAFPHLKLAVEVDGGIHRMPVKRIQDQKRQKVLESLGWTVLRFWNHEVTRDIQKVKAALSSTISQLTGTQAIQ